MLRILSLLGKEAPTTLAPKLEALQLDLKIVTSQIMLTSSTQSMWGVNPHKTVSSQTRRKKNIWHFWFFYLIFYEKEQAELQIWNRHLKNSLFLISLREANIQNPLDIFSQNMEKNKLLSSNGNTQKICWSQVSKPSPLSVCLFTCKDYLSHQVYFFEVILDLDTFENLLSKSWLRKWDNWMP